MKSTITLPTRSARTEFAAGANSTAWWVWFGYLAAILAAELTVALWSPQVGMALHLALLAILIIHASIRPSQERPLLVALMLAPLVRIVSLTMPLTGLPLVYRCGLISLPLFAATLWAIRILGLTWRQIGLRVPSWPVQLGIGLLGVPIGITEYRVLQPAAPPAELSWPMLLASGLVLLIATGFLEELIFRGLLLVAAERVSARRAELYVAAVFAALYVGYLSPPQLILAFSVGLSFAMYVTRTRSLLGVSLAHGLANVLLFLIIPVLAPQPAPTTADALPVTGDPLPAPFVAELADASPPDRPKLDQPAPPESASPLPAGPDRVAQLRDRVAKAEADLRAGSLEAAIELGEATQTQVAVRFTLGDGRRPVGFHLISTYKSEADRQSIERITIGQQAWERRDDGEWLALAPDGSEWAQIKALLPGVNAVGADALRPGLNADQLRWFDPYRDADVTLQADPVTGVPQRLVRVTRSTGMVLTVIYRDWNVPVDISPPASAR